MLYLLQQGSVRWPLCLLPDPPPLLHPVGARVREHLSHLINSGVSMKGILILQRWKALSSPPPSLLPLWWPLPCWSPPAPSGYSSPGCGIIISVSHVWTRLIRSYLILLIWMSKCDFHISVCHVSIRSISRWILWVLPGVPQAHVAAWPSPPSPWNNILTTF